MNEVDWLDLWRELVARNSRTGTKSRMVERYKGHARKRAERPDPLLEFILGETGAGETVIDIGPGNGRWTIPLAKKAGHVTAVEPTSAMADMLREKVDGAGLGNVEILPQTWEEASPAIHDVVLCAHGMYGSPDLAAFVRKMESLARRRCYLALRLPPADGIMAELSLAVRGCRHDSPDALVAYNALYTLGIYANVLIEEGMAHWVNATLEEAFQRARKHLRLDPSETVSDELISAALARRLKLADGVYTWPDGMRSALLWWSPQRRD